MSIASTPNFDPFSEPHTIAGRWDVTELFNPVRLSNRNKVRRIRPARRVQVKVTAARNEAKASEPLFDPFPSPSTFPANWNLTELD